MNSDLLTNINFKDFYVHFKESNAAVSVAIISYNVRVPMAFSIWRVRRWQH